MSFNISGRLNNLAATTNGIISDLSQLQRLINTFVTATNAQTAYQRLSNIASVYNRNPASGTNNSASYTNTSASSCQISLRASLPL